MTNIDKSTRPKVKVTSVNQEKVNKACGEMVDFLSKSIESYLSSLLGFSEDEFTRSLALNMLAPSSRELVVGSPVVGKTLVDNNLKAINYLTYGNQLWVQRVNPAFPGDINSFEHQLVGDVIEDEDCAKDESFALKP